MFRKYIVINKLTGYPCFNGHRFWSVNGATKKILRNFPPGFVQLLSIHRLVK